MKKKILVLLLALSAVVLTACGTPPAEETTGTETQTQRRPSYPYDLTQYVRMGDPNEVSAVFADPTVCTQEELDAAILQVVLANATYHEKETAAELYDKVVFDFDFFYEDKIQESYCREDFQLILGDFSNPELEALLSEALIGAKIGDECAVDYTYPDGVASGTWRGKTIHAVATVKKIYGHTFPEFDDAFAQSIQGMNFSTADQFRDSLRQDIMKQKERAMVAAVWTEFSKTVEVIQYPKYELERYKEDYRSYYENQAKELKLAFDEYLSAYLDTDRETFEKEVQTYSEELCRNEMVFCQLARQFQVQLTEEEYRQTVLEYYSQSSAYFSSLEEYEAYYGREELWEEASWHKALLILAGYATRLDA